MEPQFKQQLRKMITREKTKSDRISKFLHFWRKGYPIPALDLRRDLEPRGHHGWLALSAAARIETAKLILEDLSSVSRADRRRLGKVSSLLFTSEEWCSPLETAGTMSFDVIRREIIRRLDGQSFVGVIEPGLYRDRKMPGAAERGLVSWHVHAIWAGQDRQALNRSIADFNADHKGSLKGVDPANQRSRSWETIGIPTAYMLKTPAKSYTTYFAPNDINPATGEVGADRQRSKALRPGESIKLLNLFAETFIDDIMIVGGAGWEWTSSLQAAILANRAGWLDRYGEQGGLRGGLHR